MKKYGNRVKLYKLKELRNKDPRMRKRVAKYTKYLKRSVWLNHSDSNVWHER